MKIFVICPVRNIADEEKNAIEVIVKNLEKNGEEVYWPPRDTNQYDSIGLRICCDNRKAIEEADCVYVWWNEKSQGSLFDLGMAFALKKPVYVINITSVKITENKSFNNVLRALHYRQTGRV